MQYRRVYVPGGSYFFTLITQKRRKILVGEATIDVLREAFRRVMKKRPFYIDAAVILPDHLHGIWMLPPEDQDFSTRWRLIKTWFTKHCNTALRENSDHTRKRKGEQAIWQHRYWEHLLRDDHDYARHVEYIHYNPVKHLYVSKPFDWPYSSFRRYVKQGIYKKDWGTMAVEFAENIGME